MLKAIGGWLGYWFFAALFSVGTLYIGVPAIQSLNFAFKVGSFPSAPGIMVDHKIKSEVTRRNVDEHGPQETRITYTPWLVYRFATPDGTSYEAEEMLTAELTNHVKTSQTRAEAFADRYPKGQEVTVYYNPEDPFEAALTTSKTRMFWVLQAGYCAAALVGLLLVGWSLWKGVRSLAAGFRRGTGSA